MTFWIQSCRGGSPGMEMHNANEHGNGQPYMVSFPDKYSFRDF